MPNGVGLGNRPGQGEYTRPGTETEVIIPWQTFLKMGVLGDIGIGAIIVCTWLVRLGTYLAQDTPHVFFGRIYWWSKFPLLRWMITVWWPTFRVRWPWSLVALILWWIVPILPTLYRYTIETLTKHMPPVPMPWDLANGMWWPWKRAMPKQPPIRAKTPLTIDFGLDEDKRDAH